MKKVVMNLEDYKGKYAMHCPTEWSAKLFLDFLYKNSLKWHDVKWYCKALNFSIGINDAVYYFNKGEFGGRWVAEKEGYKILEIDDFIQEVYE